MTAALLLSACGTAEPAGPPAAEALADARVLAYRGETAAAFRAFASLAAAEPGLLDAWEGAVDAAAGAGGAERAALARDLAAAPGEGDRTAREVLAAMLEQDLEARERALYRLAERNGPDAGWADAALGDVFAARGNARAAHDFYRRALERTPGLARALRGLHRSLIALGRKTEAVRQLEEYLFARPRDPIALYNLGVILYRDQGRLRDARPYLERALNVLQDDVPTLLALAGIALDSRPAEVDEAEEHLGRALALAPEDPDVHWNLGVLYADHRSRPRRAVEHFRKYLELGGGERARVERWIAELEAGADGR